MSAEASVQFVDTNILVYAYDRSAGKKHERGRELLKTLWESGLGGLSIQVLQEFFVTITRKVSYPLPANEAMQIVSDLGAWRVHSPGVEDVCSAISIHERNQISFWDAMIIRSALQLGCTTIYSEDLSHRKVYEGIRVINPFMD
jgi:predicted nucleic acid-binding protein